MESERRPRPLTTSRVLVGFLPVCLLGIEQKHAEPDGGAGRVVQRGDARAEVDGLLQEGSGHARARRSLAAATQRRAHRRGRAAVGQKVDAAGGPPSQHEVVEAAVVQRAVHTEAEPACALRQVRGAHERATASQVVHQRRQLLRQVQVPLQPLAGGEREGERSSEVDVSELLQLVEPLRGQPVELLRGRDRQALHVLAHHSAPPRHKRMGQPADQPADCERGAKAVVVQRSASQQNARRGEDGRGDSQAGVGVERPKAHLPC
eukprot:scaffold102576_cov66-Phaeocystis_antarctica.AAC.2